jgi:hypothetical protein
MPAPKPSSLPDWDTSLSNLAAPSGGQIASGWTIDQVPPSNWFNWWMNLVGQWSDYLNDFEIQSHTWTAAQTFNALVTFVGGLSVNALTVTNGLTASRTTSNSNAISATGNGTGAGISATGGATGTAGALGIAGTGSNGDGQHGIGDGTGAGASGVGGSSGPGLKGMGNSNRGAINAVPQSTPASPANGDIWVTSTGANIKTAAGTIPLIPPTGPTLVSSLGYQTNWGDGGTTPYFYQDAAGVVRLEGSVLNSAGTGAGVHQITTAGLPSGLRPTATRNFYAQDTGISGSGAVVIQVDSAGLLYVTGSINSGVSIWLDGISFLTV